ncbi:MAG: hypothetical protein RQ864_11240 [Lutibacter sp.]|nr:hypothetical protein [Lutibacter sp.]MDT8418371.1 hypothetical protein [Lutibacter sp.]
MKATQLQQINSTPFLKVVNNSLGKSSAITEQVKRIYINTLMPGFNYINSAGESITPKKCAFI